jgi:hypothetical protein
MPVPGPNDAVQAYATESSPNHLSLSLSIFFRKELRDNDSAHHCFAFLHLSHLSQLSCPMTEPCSVRNCDVCNTLIVFHVPVGFLCFPKYILHADAPSGCGEMNKGMSALL